jgi:hypothetical protein
VRTYTSSSSARIGDTRLGKAWLLAAGLSLLTLVSWECFWRSRGFRPYMRDGARLWAMQRRRASALGERALVIAGGSRVQVGLDLDVLRHRIGLEPVMLGIDATTSIPVLEDLAADERVCGTVLVSVTPNMLRPSRHNTAYEYVGIYRSRGPADACEDRLADFMDWHLAFRSPALSHHAIIRALRYRRMPVARAPKVRRDRSRPIDYTVTNPEPRKHRVARALAGDPQRSDFSPEAFLVRAVEVEAMAERIRSRGGRVVFLHMPVTGDLWTLYEINFPREDYWDRFVELTAFPAIHFADHESLIRFECPDTSHLDASDRTAFTQALADVLLERLGTGGGPSEAPR